MSFFKIIFLTIFYFIVSLFLIFSTNIGENKDDSLLNHFYSPFKRILHFEKPQIKQISSFNKYDNGKSGIYLPNSYELFDFIQMYIFVTVVMSLVVSRIVRNLNL